MAENRQLPLELALAPRFGEEDFLISQSNADAYGMIEAWPDWVSRLLVMTGPPASGKSHLAAIWAAKANARQLSARSLGKADIPALIAASAVVVEDIDRSGIAEAALFHLVNLAEEKGASLLFTSARPPQELGLVTPDLLSRLRKAPLVSIAAPDDALMRALFVKMFVDRQLIVDTALVEYLCLRIERSFVAVRSTVEKLDHGAMARGRRLTRPMAATILGWTTES
jgi:chromosomal replication initiation ATPase DnaA